MAGLGSLSKSLTSTLGERRAQVCLIELNDKDEPLGEALAFQYFPDTISDTKAVNYQTKEIPGASLPLYQWISSGERVITFTATFTSDLDLLSDPTMFQKFVNNGLVRRNIDPRAAFTWLRRFMLPRYGEVAQLGIPLTKAPRKLLLFIPNSGIGLAGGTIGVENGGKNDDFGIALSGASAADRVVVIMLQSDITFQASFPSGMPRIIEVSLSFAQIAQVGGTISFPADSDALSDIVLKGKKSDSIAQSGVIFPYPFKVSVK